MIEPIDPLIDLAGRPVASAEAWWSRRVPELREAFQREVYGELPGPVPVSLAQQAEADDLEGGAVHYRGLRVELDLGRGEPHPVHVALFTPAGVARPPLFLAPCATSLPSIHPHPAIVEGANPVLAPHVAEPQFFERGEKAAAWPIGEICGRGYALAVFCTADAEPDQPDNPHGLRARLEPSDQHPWGAVACWAWTAMRVLDALEPSPAVDASRVAITGMSRRGKAALLAGAFDPRFRLVIPHQSGTGGMALSRLQPEESVERITTVFPHWFTPRFANWARHETGMRIDQHLLIALCAPRAILGLAGDQDTWASPRLAAEALHQAAPVWKLLGASDVVGSYRDRLPDGPLPALMQLWRDTPHLVDAGYWRGYLDAADRFLR